MTIVVAYADTPPGHAAVAAAVEESSRESESVVLVPAVRGEAAPSVADLVRRWPGAEGRLEVEAPRLMPLRDAAKAHALMEASQHTGKILLKVA